MPHPAAPLPLVRPYDRLRSYVAPHRPRRSKDQAYADGPTMDMPFRPRALVGTRVVLDAHVRHVSGHGRARRRQGLHRVLPRVEERLVQLACVLGVAHVRQCVCARKTGTNDWLVAEMQTRCLMHVRVLRTARANSGCWYGRRGPGVLLCGIRHGGVLASVPAAVGLHRR